MKKTILLIMMSFALLVTSCKGDKDRDLSELLIGQWTIEEYVPATKSAMIGDEPIYVTLVFMEGNKFILKQRIGEAFTESFEGTWSLEGTMLSGVYSDNKPWGEKYDISFSDDDNTLEMKTSKVQEVYIYHRYFDKE